MEEDEEIWKPVRGYEGLYEVSSIGRVRSLNYYGTGKEKILPLTAQPNRYFEVNLFKDGKQKCAYVHRLMGEVFLPQPQSGETQINHINGDKHDNRISSQYTNLEWVTPKQNINNPNTLPNMRRRYHREGEFERRSAAAKKRHLEHPEILQKTWEKRRKKKED